MRAKRNGAEAGGEDARRAAAAPPRRRGLRFWQKTYLLALALFLAALFGGTAFMGWQSQRQSYDGEVESVRAEQLFIAQALAQDLAVIEDGGAPLRVQALARSYGEHYAESGMLLELRRGGDVLFSNLPGAEGGEGDPSSGDFEAPADPGRQAWAARELDGAPHLLVGSALPKGLDGYTLVCARSLEGLHASWERMRATLVGGSVCTSALLAVALYFALRSLSKPLERLAATADAFAAGNLGARAEQRGDDEVGKLARSLNAMADAAERDIAEIQHIAEANARMAANLSHEIRTPLTAVRGYAEYLRLADASAEERDSALAAIIEESERMRALSQRMLQLASLDHDEAPLAACDLGRAVERALRDVRPAARAAGVELAAEPLEHVAMTGDETLLESLAANLADNAVKACEPGGAVSVSVTVEADGRTAVLTVRDDGRGLSPDELDKLGEPFYRPDKARSRAAGGAGLGVALCRQIAALHGAALTYASAPGQGTVARVEFTVS